LGFVLRKVATCRVKENRVLAPDGLEDIVLVEIDTCRMMEKATGRETVRPFRLRTRRLSRSDPPLINSIHI
jgi:hypothetical protein